jgi:hypothetical protein
MAYFPDLSRYTYRKRDEECAEYNIAWLDRDQDYPKGDVSSVFLDRLWRFCSLRVSLSRGFHFCNLCSSGTGSEGLVTHNSETLVLGTAEIRVFGCAGRVYAAPDLIFHYVKAHAYKPPEEFIHAVLTGPLPGSSEYDALLNQIGLSGVEPLREIVYWPVK